MREILAVIPARSGSKRIRNKNLRLLRGHPLIAYVLETALASRYISTIVVSSDSDQVLSFAGNFRNMSRQRQGVAARFKDIILRKRPPELARDEVTLDPVVYDATSFAEARTGKRYEIVITLQPTSPTLSVRTLDTAIENFLEASYDSLLSVVEDTCLKWRLVNNKPVPLYEKRLNSQWLPKEYKETGAFLISRREVLTPYTRLGHRIGIYPLPVEEALDIDDPFDWLLADAFLSYVKIAFVVVANKQVGMGHLYRCITLADAFLGHSIHMYGVNCSNEALKVAADYGYLIEPCPNLDTVCEKINNFNPDIVVNDVLDTEVSYVEKLRKAGYFVVNFEDLGPGSDRAHLVFNALYELSDPPSNHMYGPRYVCLREEFLSAQPAPFREPARTLLVTFGGVDECNLTCKTLKALPKILTTTTLEKVIVVLGPAYSHREELERTLATLPSAVRGRIEVYNTVPNMAELISHADVAVTSNGRTVYELAAMGVPALTIAQNDREALHLFSRYSRGFRYLGQASNVSVELIATAIREIVEDRAQRKNMRSALLQADIRGGLERVRRKIINCYWRWKNEAS